VPIADLTSSLDGWDRFEYFTVAIVIIGVAGESVVELTNFIKSESRRKQFGRGSALLLIFGLSLELLALVKVNNISGQIIATLDNDAAQARKEQELLKQIVNWRIIPFDKLKEASRRLSAAKTKGAVRLSYVLFDSESFWLAKQLEIIFDSAPGWKLQFQAHGYAGVLVTGVHIPGPDTEIAQTVRESFALTGLTFTTQSPPQPALWAGAPTEPPADVEIIVGTKVPPSGQKITIPFGMLPGREFPLPQQ
jgi:hypothetical protein